MQKQKMEPIIHLKEKDNNTCECVTSENLEAVAGKVNSDKRNTLDQKNVLLNYIFSLLLCKFTEYASNPPLPF